VTLRTIVSVGLLGVGGAGCNLLVPTCLGRQERHSTEPRTAQIEPGALVVLHLSYDIRGSQNDIEIEWSSRLDGTRIEAYATRAECETGPERGNASTDSCRVLSRGGNGTSQGPIRLILTHGRGNPETLGNPPDFKIWIYGDPAKATTYTLTASSFYGPDC
jgi:hypothetical protein